MFMAMIHPKRFLLQWIQAIRDELGVTDPGILEKSIHALALLSHLSDSGVEFVLMAEQACFYT